MLQVGEVRVEEKSFVAKNAPLDGLAKGDAAAQIRERPLRSSG
jgi:hypothetical protein